MKTLSIKQLQTIKECFDEIKMGVYDQAHMEVAYRLIDAHYDSFEFYSPSIRYWMKNNYQSAVQKAYEIKLQKEAKDKIKENVND